MNPDTNKFEPLHVEEQKSTDDATHNKTGEQLRRQVQDLRQEMKRLRKESIASVTGMLLRPNGEPVPKHWSVFTIGENVAIKEYTFKVAYIGETSILFEPVGPLMVESKKDE